MIPLEINGNSLSFDELRQVVYERREVTLAATARSKVAAAREVVDKLLRENRVAYAINTGVGKLSDVHIEPATMACMRWCRRREAWAQAAILRLWPTWRWR
jgi:histidine ammonia-lyase